MSNPVQNFEFNSRILRVEVDEDGNPWFMAKDVCNILGYENHNNAVKDHCREDGVSKRYPILDNLGRTQYPVFINEGNLYRLIIKSNKPEAEPFEAWVCDEVLPSIRKHGYYVNPNARQPTNADLFDDMPNEQLPFQRVKPSLLIKLGKMSKALAQAYLVECGVTPDYVQQQLGTLGDAAPMLGVSMSDNIELLAAQFADDWKAQTIAAPFVCCTGAQALRLFTVWAEQKGHVLRTGENRIMAALYRMPGFYHKRTRHGHNRQGAMLMIEGCKPPVNVGHAEWLSDCVAQMEDALRRLEV